MAASTWPIDWQARSEARAADACPTSCFLCRSGEMLVSLISDGGCKWCQLYCVTPCGYQLLALTDHHRVGCSSVVCTGGYALTTDNWPLSTEYWSPIWLYTVVEYTLVAPRGITHWKVGVFSGVWCRSVGSTWFLLPSFAGELLVVQ